MKKLENLVTIVPIIGKGDSLTSEETKEHKENVTHHNMISELNIILLDFKSD